MLNKMDNINNVKVYCKNLIEAIEEMEKRIEEEKNNEKYYSKYKGFGDYGRFHENGKIKALTKILSYELIELRRQR